MSAMIPSKDFEIDFASKTAHLMNTAFNEDLILEKIIGYVLGNQNEKDITKKDLKTLRLVSRGWQKAANKFLKKSRHPLYRLNLVNVNCTSEFYVEATDNLAAFYKFTDTIRESLFPECLPPYSLTIRQEMLREETNKTFSEFIFTNASGLVELTLYVPDINELRKTFVFQNYIVNFPNLRKLKIIFQRGFACLYAPSNPITIRLIQLILNHSKDLKHLDISLQRLAKIPSEFKSLIFPSSLTHLAFNCNRTSTDLGILLNQQLPYLYELKLWTSAKSASDENLSKILEKFKTSLRVLVIDYDESNPSQEANFIRFPIMEKLIRLSIYSPYLELKACLPSRQNNFPNLILLTLLHQSVGFLLSWTQNFKFPSVRHLNIICKDPNNRDPTVLPNIIIRLSHILPHLNHLAICFTCNEMKVMTNIFKSLNRLQTLHVFLYKLDACMLTQADHNMDTILTGIDPQEVCKLLTTRDYFENKKLEDLPANKRQIALKRLYLAVCGPHASNTKTHFITPVTFKFASLRMPKLKHISLGTGFQVPEVFTGEWKNSCEGRTVKYF